MPTELRLTKKADVESALVMEAQIPAIMLCDSALRAAHLSACLSCMHRSGYKRKGAARCSNFARWVGVVAAHPLLRSLCEVKYQSLKA